MFNTRLISGILLVAVALITIISGGDVLAVTLLGVSIIGLGELFQIRSMQFQAPALIIYAATLIYYLLLRFALTEYLWMMAVALLLLLMAVYVFTFPKYDADQMMLAFFGFFYVTVLLSFVYRTRMLENGGVTVWLVFLCSWGYDTCAYCVGMLTGKLVGNHKMTPKLSPKKSVEGAVGGLIGAVLLGAAYAAIMGSVRGEAQPVLEFMIICGVGAVIAQIGDLAASAIKRNYNLKDYGTIIPGHGGVLDRFDSVIFTAPVIFYLASMLNV